MKAYELLADEHSWCQGHAATTGFGTPTTALGQSARRWCIMGAVVKCYPEDAATRVAVLQLAAGLTGGPAAIAEWNDRATHAEVLALLRKANL